MCSKLIKTLASVPKSSWRPVFGDALLLAYTVKTFALVWSHSSSAAVCVCVDTLLPVAVMSDTLKQKWKAIGRD